MPMHTTMHATALGIFLGLAVPALAQPAPDCGMPGRPPCPLRGYKLLTNKQAPNILMLQIETNAGPRTFVASPVIMERFARELLQGVQRAGTGRRT